jgi:hypothetical protein
MKKAVLLLAMLIATLASFEQTTVSGDNVVVRQELTIGGTKIDTVQTDTTFTGKIKSIPTSETVRKFVEGRTLPLEPANQHKYLMGNFYKKLYAQRSGAAQVKWLYFGDSYAGIIYQHIGDYVKNMAGENNVGAYNGGPYNGVTLNARSGSVIDNTTDYDIWPTGLSTTFNSGGSITYGIGGGSALSTKIKVYYAKEPTGGTFKLQVNGADATGFTNVSASGTLGQLGIATITQAPTVSTLNVVGLSGSVRVVGIAFEDSTRNGLVSICVSQGGIALGGSANSATGHSEALSNFSQFLADVKPTVFTLEMKEDASYFASALNTFFTAINPQLTNTDVVLIGSPPVASGDAGQVMQNGQLEAAAKAFGYKYYDTYKLFGNYASLAALGWQGDGVHVTNEANQYRGMMMLNDLGILSQYKGISSFSVYNDSTRTNRLLIGDGLTPTVKIIPESTFKQDATISTKRWLYFTGEDGIVNGLSWCFDGSGLVGSFTPDFFRIGNSSPGPFIWKYDANNLVLTTAPYNFGSYLVGLTMGNLYCANATLQTTPTTSAGSYDVLTRNTSTGMIEKVSSSLLGGGGTSTGTVTSVFGRSGIVSADSSDYHAFYPSLTTPYFNPSWLSTLDWSKITNRPTTLSGYGITTDNTTIANIGTPSTTRQGLYFNSTGNIQNFKMIGAGTGITLSSNDSNVVINAIPTSTPTLAQVTTAGNTTPNWIYVTGGGSQSAILNGQINITDAIGGLNSSAPSYNEVSNGSYTTYMRANYLQFAGNGNNDAVRLYGQLYPSGTTNVYLPARPAGGTDTLATKDDIRNILTNTTASNIGSPSVTRQGLYYTKIGNDLQFRMIQAGTGITLSSDANNVTINASGTTAGVTSFYNRSGAVYPDAGDYSPFYPALNGSYSNPSWITGLAWSKIINRPTTMSGYGITDDNTSIANIGTPSTTRQGLFYNTSGNYQNFRMIQAGTGITLSSDASNVTVNAVTPSMAQLFAGSSTNIATASTIWFGGIGIATTPMVAEYNSFICPKTMVVDSVTIRSYIEEGGSGNVIFTLYKNETATSMTMTILGENNAIYTTHVLAGPVTFNAGDRMELVVTNSCGVNMNVPSWAIAYK